MFTDKNDKTKHESVHNRCLYILGIKKASMQVFTLCLIAPVPGYCILVTFGLLSLTFCSPYLIALDISRNIAISTSS